MKQAHSLVQRWSKHFIKLTLLRSASAERIKLSNAKKTYLLSYMLRVLRMGLSFGTTPFFAFVAKLSNFA